MEYLCIQCMRVRCTGNDDYCDACRLLDAGNNIQNIHSGFAGVFANLEAMRAAGDAAGIDAVMTDMQNVMQRIQAMQAEASRPRLLEVAA